MVSKGLTIGLVAFLVLALVGGSAYILLRPDAAAAVESRTGYAQGSGRSGGQGNGSQGDGQSQGQAAAAQGRQGFQGGREAGQERGRTEDANGDGLAEHPLEARTTLQGTVLALERDTLTMETGVSSITVHLGPEWYWELAGIEILAGQVVEVTGFHEGDTFVVADVDNLETGATAILRDESGRPLWAGRGRQGQGGSLRS